MVPALQYAGTTGWHFDTLGRSSSRQKLAHIKKDTGGGGRGVKGGGGLVIYRKVGTVSKLHTCERVLTSSAS